MKYSEEQTLAYKAYGNNVLVSAGAGSGKTQVLSERVRYLVEEKGLKITEFLILTFTKAAASEMKERIRKKLEDINSEEAKYVDNAYISNFDSFANAMVNKYGHLINLDPGIEVLDQTIEKYIIKNFINEEIDKEILRGNEDINNLIAIYYDAKKDILVEGLFDVINEIYKHTNIYEYIDLLKNKVTDISDVEIDEMDYLDRKMDLINICIGQFTSNTTRKTFEEFSNMYSEADSLYEKISIIKGINLKKGDRSEESFEIKNNIKEIRDEVKKYFDDYPDYQEEKTVLKNSINLMIDICEKVIKRIEEFKKQYNTYTFSDIANFAIRIFEENPQVRMHLQNSIKTIMIDEYQDTSPIQEKFISLISNGHNVYQVGDVKQAIYRFRNALPDIFIEKFTKYKNHEDGELICLNNNFRSRGEILDDINKIFSKIMTEKIGGADYAADHIILSGNGEYKENKIKDCSYNIETINYDSDKADPVLEAKIIAEDIVKKMNEKYQIYDKGKHAFRDCRFSDFSILISSGGKFKIIEKVFKDYKIPLYVYQNENIKESDLCLVLISALNLAKEIKFNKGKYSAKYRHAFMSLSRSFLYFDNNDDEIYSYVKSSSYKQSKVVQDIEFALDRAKDKSVYAFLEEFIEISDLYYSFIKCGDVNKNETIFIRFRSFISSLKKFNYSFNEYIEFFKFIYSDDGNKIEISDVLKKSSSVIMMNIHKSKGLQFPIVYCPNMTSAGKVNAPKLITEKYGLVPHSPISNKPRYAHYVENEKNNLDDISEKIRLFYVQLTRAEEKIYVLMRNGYEAQDLAKAKTFADYYAPTMDLLPSSTYEPYEVSLINTEKSQENVDLKYEDINIPYVEKENFAKASKDIDVDVSISSLEYGTKLHFLLELIDFKNPDFSLIEDEKEAQLIKKFLNTEIIKNLKSPKFYKEYEFRDDKNNTKGIIDLLIVDENKAYIVDYKLKNIDDENYKKQLKVYYDYITAYTKLTPVCYLYSILTGDIILINIY